MSFLQQLCNKKNSLKSTNTTVTRPDGTKFLESSSQKIELSEKSFGFVVDTKADNIPAEILNYLYLGSQDCCELSVLTTYKIEFVLSLGIRPCNLHEGIVYKFVECLDLPETNIIEILQKNCLEFINDALGMHKNILVHCNAGVSRSSSIVIGFLMLAKDLTYKDAFDFVKSKRSCIRPNDGFEKQLKAFKLNGKNDKLIV